MVLSNHVLIQTLFSLVLIGAYAKSSHPKKEKKNESFTKTLNYDESDIEKKWQVIWKWSKILYWKWASKKWYDANRKFHTYNSETIAKI